jgi:hypothetical protein
MDLSNQRLGTKQFSSGRLRDGSASRERKGEEQEQERPERFAPESDRSLGEVE